MAIVVLRCSCGARYRIHTSRKFAAVFHHHFGRTVQCDGNCRHATVDKPADPQCSQLTGEPARGPLAAAFA